MQSSMRGNWMRGRKEVIYKTKSEETEKRLLTYNLWTDTLKTNKKTHRLVLNKQNKILSPPSAVPCDPKKLHLRVGVTVCEHSLQLIHLCHPPLWFSTWNSSPGLTIRVWSRVAAPSLFPSALTPGWSSPYRHDLGLLNSILFLWPPIHPLLSLGYSWPILPWALVWRSQGVSFCLSPCPGASH